MDNDAEALDLLEENLNDLTAAAGREALADLKNKADSFEFEEAGEIVQNIAILFGFKLED